MNKFKKEAHLTFTSYSEVLELVPAAFQIGDVRCRETCL
jgi:hypothetical protein